MYGSAARQGHVTPFIDRKIARQPPVPFTRGLEGHGICPCSEQGLDEPLRLPVGSRCVGPSSFGRQAQGCASFSPGLDAVGTAVIGEHSPASNALGTNQAGARSRKPTVVACFSSGSTST
jgi:hypothetical protein